MRRTKRIVVDETEVQIIKMLEAKIGIWEEIVNEDPDADLTAQTRRKGIICELKITVKKIKDQEYRIY